MITFLFFIKTESPQTLDFTALIGATGFEPATSRPPAVRATKLRHTPRTVDIVSNVIIKINSFFKKQIKIVCKCYCERSRRVTHV